MKFFEKMDAFYYKIDKVIFYLKMPKAQQLSEFERGMIIGGWKFGHSERDIGDKLGISKSVVFVATIDCKYSDNGLDKISE